MLQVGRLDLSLMGVRGLHLDVVAGIWIGHKFVDWSAFAQKNSNVNILAATCQSVDHLE